MIHYVKPFGEMICMDMKIPLWFMLEGLDKIEKTPSTPKHLITVRGLGI